MFVWISRRHVLAAFWLKKVPPPSPSFWHCRTSRVHESGPLSQLKLPSISSLALPSPRANKGFRVFARAHPAKGRVGYPIVWEWRGIQFTEGLDGFRI